MEEVSIALPFLFFEMTDYAIDRYIDGLMA